VSASGRSLVVIAALGVLIVLLIVLFPRVKPRADGSEGASTNASARNDTKPEETDPAVLTSEELIATALKSGAITYEESLIERAFAWFDDPRLRKEFRSRIVDWEAGGWLLDEIHRKEASLSQATLATLAPFRARPSDSASIFNQPRTDAVRALYAPAAQEWASALVPGGNGWTPLRIWIKGTAADLAPYLSNAKRMWASYHNFFVDPWEDDGDTTKDFNPDDAVDMYLLHVGQVDPRCASTPCSTAAATNGGWTSIAQPDRGRQCAGYAIVNLDQRHDEVIGAMAHELTHTAQRMYECADRYDFLTEGTATWVGYKVLRDMGIKPDYAYDFLDNPRRYSFFRNLKQSLDRPQNSYPAWTFYYYASMELGNDVVKRIWENHSSGAGMTGAHTVNKVVPFEEHFPQFAVRNWNQEAVPLKYWDQDSTFPHAKPMFVNPMPTAPSTTELSQPVPSLAAQYYHYRSFDDSVRRITLENFYADVPNAHVWALKKIGNDWKLPEDWSKEQQHILCRDIPSEDVTELVLIVSNSDISNELPAGHPKPRVLTEDVGCETVEGWGQSTLRLNDPEHNVDVTYVASLTTLQFRPRTVQEVKGNMQYDLLPASVVWKVSGREGNCSISGRLLVRIPGAVDQPLDSTRPAWGYLNVVPRGGGDFHTVWINAWNLDDLSEIKTCPGNPPRISRQAFRSAYLLHVLRQENTHDGNAVSFKGLQTVDQVALEYNLAPPALEVLKSLPGVSQMLNQGKGKMVYTFEWQLRPRRRSP